MGDPWWCVAAVSIASPANVVEWWFLAGHKLVYRPVEDALRPRSASFTPLNESNVPVFEGNSPPCVIYLCIFWLLNFITIAMKQHLYSSMTCAQVIRVVVLSNHPLSWGRATCSRNDHVLRVNLKVWGVTRMLPREIKVADFSAGSLDLRPTWGSRSVKTIFLPRVTWKKNPTNSYCLMLKFLKENKVLRYNG